MGRCAGVLVWLLGCASWLGCGPDLGPCDQARAETVVFKAGIPYYEGQALVEAHCAGSFCHTANAKGAQRIGVPAELDFDVSTVTAASPAAFAQLADGVDRVRDWAETMWSQVDAGNMPPGEAGRRDVGVWVHALADGSVPQGCPNDLSGIETAEGKSILRNWLACGAPVVAATEDACSALPDLATVGACLPAGQGDPSEADIYERIITGRGCVSGCHEPGGLGFADHQLDLSSDPTDPTRAYVAVLDVPAKGAACAVDAASGQPNVLIRPGDCQGSLLYQKLAATSDDQVCGSRMPLVGTMVPADELALLCAWIDAGAQMTAPSTSSCGP